MNALKVMLAKKNREVNPESWEQLYRNLIVRDIRKNVAPSLNEENAILRKTLANLLDYLLTANVLTEKQAVKLFSEFYDYHYDVEACKENVKKNLT